MEVDKSRLIAEIRKRPMLWDVRKYKIDSNWKEVSKILGVSVSTCKKTWKTLRCCYYREIRYIEDRIAKSKSEGTYDPERNYSTWNFFEPLRFAFGDLVEAEIAESDHQSQTYTNYGCEKSKGCNRQRIPDKSVQEDTELFKHMYSICVKEEPEFQIDAESQPIDDKDSDGPHCEQVPKEYPTDTTATQLQENSAAELCHSHATNESSKRSQFSKDYEKHDQKIIKPGNLSTQAVDITDLDYSFLISFLSHMKLMSQIQKLRFRAKMSNLMLNIISTSSSDNILGHQRLLVDVGDPDGNFLISFWPYLKSMSWSKNLQFRAKIADLILNILEDYS